jgi:hypothetical protein
MNIIRLYHGKYYYKNKQLINKINYNRLYCTINNNSNKVVEINNPDKILIDYKKTNYVNKKNNNNNNCYTQKNNCFRCGRETHYADECYAIYHINGIRLN